MSEIQTKSPAVSSGKRRTTIAVLARPRPKPASASRGGLLAAIDQFASSTMKKRARVVGRLGIRERRGDDGDKRDRRSREGPTGPEQERDGGRGSEERERPARLVQRRGPDLDLQADPEPEPEQLGAVSAHALEDLPGLMTAR